jgi:flagellar biogenesis protein FliO
MTLQVVFVYGTAFAVATLVLYGAIRFFSRGSVPDGEPAFGPPPTEIQVLTRTRVGIGRSLVVVEVEGRRLLLGSTRQSWAALADLGAARSDAPFGPADSIEAELARAVEASRQRRGGRKP